MLGVPTKETKKYWVQWVTKFDSEQGHLQVVGHCVRSNKETLFQHKDYEVCVKVCEMLNEGEVTKC